MERKLKILYLITTLDIGGAEQLLLLILKNLDKEKFVPTVCCFSGGALAEEIKNLGIKVIDLKVGIKFNIIFLFRFYRILKKGKFDIVHTHLFHANIIGRIMARLCRIPVVVSTQHYAFKYKGGLRVYLEKITAGLSDRIIAVSDAARRFYINEIGIPEKRLVLIHNGIDLSMLNEGSLQRPGLREELSLNNDFLIGCIGSFTEVKGHVYLLKAIAEVIKAHSKIKVLLIGSGILEKYLRKVTNDLGISNNVVFIGKRRDITNALASFDIFVMPSLQEGLSIILLEAMAMGKPVIATAVGGNSEVIIHGENGILIPPSDHKAIADAIIDLFKNKDKAKRLGVNAILRVAKGFDIKENVHKTETLYEGLFKNLKKKYEKKTVRFYSLPRL